MFPITLSTLFIHLSIETSVPQSVIRPCEQKLAGQYNAILHKRAKNGSNSQQMEAYATSFPLARVRHINKKRAIGRRT